MAAAIRHFCHFPKHNRLAVSLTRRGEAVHTTRQHGFSRDDFVVSGNAAYQGLKRIRRLDPLEFTVLVYEAISVVVAYDHAVIADTMQGGVAGFVVVEVQRGKCAVAVDKSVGISTAVMVAADNYSVIVEAARRGTLCTGNLGDGEECAVAAALEHVTHAVAVQVPT